MFLAGSKDFATLLKNGGKSKNQGVKARGGQRERGRQLSFPIAVAAASVLSGSCPLSSLTFSPCSATQGQLLSLRELQKRAHTVDLTPFCD